MPDIFRRKTTRNPRQDREGKQEKLLTVRRQQMVISKKDNWRCELRDI